MEILDAQAGLPQPSESLLFIHRTMVVAHVLHTGRAQIESQEQVRCSFGRLQELNNVRVSRVLTDDFDLSLELWQHPSHPYRLRLDHLQGEILLGLLMSHLVDNSVGPDTQNLDEIVVGKQWLGQGREQTREAHLQAG